MGRAYALTARRVVLQSWVRTFRFTTKQRISSTRWSFLLSSDQRRNLVAVRGSVNRKPQRGISGRLGRWSISRPPGADVQPSVASDCHIEMSWHAWPKLTHDWGVDANPVR
jgi:hypothetical protein